MSLKPICVPCQRFYRPTKNGQYFIEQAPDGAGAKPGTAEPEKWHPYKLWSGDQWACPDCGSEIIVGVGREPIRVQHEPDFDDYIKSFGATLKINDC